ncbi:MAG TPA: glycosyltransferase family 1 protein [Opitutaceae bacterium]|nr:glycosyltransferase family 1 protein [Opitutaceae bacterium]
MRIGVSAVTINRGGSGTGQYLLNLLGALVAEARDCEFIVFALDRDRELFDSFGPPVRVVSVGEDFRPGSRHLAWHQFVLPRLARDLALDVLHVPALNRFPWAKPCPLVGTVDNSDRFPDNPAAGWSRAWFRRTLLPALARRQDELVAVNAAAAAELIDVLGVPSCQVTVIPNGVDHARFHPGDRETAATWLAREHGLRPPFFLSVARLEHPENNLLRLIEAFNRFKAETPSPWQLVLAGPDGRGAAAVRERIRRSPYAPDIRCPGHVAPERLTTWYHAAGAFVSTAFGAGFGLAPLEAMASGCPVLVAEGSGAAELCGRAALTADASDVEAIEFQLAALAGNAPLRTHLAFAGVQRAGRFAWRKTAAATLEVYVRASRRVRVPVLTHPVLSAPVS